MSRCATVQSNGAASAFKKGALTIFVDRSDGNR
jgi:hypothetical protein